MSRNPVSKVYWRLFISIICLGLICGVRLFKLLYESCPVGVRSTVLTRLLRMKDSYFTDEDASVAAILF